MSEMVALTRTKILLPRRPDNLLTRQRLLDLLYDLLDYRLIIIAAPAGYGKTSLLVDLAHHIEMPVCWYSLDALDQDPQRFMAHFIASIAQRFPDFGKQSSIALQSDLSRTGLGAIGEHSSSTRPTSTSGNTLCSSWTTTTCHGDSEVINHFVNRFVQEVDENCHLVLSSRTLLSLPDLPLMVARSQVGGLAFEDLAFRADEIQALLLQNYHLTMPAAEAEKLAQETEGWITGLLLSAQTMWQGMADRVRLARASGVGLYDYLAQQVLDQQPAPVRDFLLRTSLMEEFDAELCEAVLGPNQDWRRLMDILLRNNCLSCRWTMGRPGCVITTCFGISCRPGWRRSAQRKKVASCGGWRPCMPSAEEWEKAHDIYHRLGDVEATADLIEQAGSSLVKSGRWATLASWIDALPAAVLASRPALLSLRGDVAVMLGEVARGLALLSQAQVSLRKTKDLPSLARTLVRRATAHRFLGQYQASLADADEALALAEQDQGLCAIRAEALRARGLGLRRLGQLSDAIDCLEQSKALYDALGNEENVALIHIDLGMVFRAIGAYELAESAYKNALMYWRKVNDAARQASVLNNLGGLNHSKGNYEQAGYFLEEALACARQSGYARAEAFALSSMGDLYADLDILNAAQDTYRQARKIAQCIHDRFLLLYLDLADAALARLTNDLAYARGLVESARQLAGESNSTYEQGLCHLEAGRQALAEQDPTEAVIPLEAATRCFDDGGQRVESARAHLYLAAAYHAAEDKTKALAHLEQTFHLMTNLESRHILVVAGQEVKVFLEAMQSEPMVGSQVSQLLRRIIQFESDIPSLRRRLRQRAVTVPLAPPRLTFLALGSAQVMVDRRQITGADWQALVARDLLFCLLAHPDGLTKEEVGVIFWPESSLAQLKLQFKQTVYRLRRALGQDVVLFDEDQYRFNRALDYEYDVDMFMEKLTQARTATHPAEQAMAYQAAIDLYKGPYLPEMDETWIWPERERLWQAYVEAILALAELHFGAGEYEAVLNCCQWALAQDPCLEEVHRLAMRAHAVMGNRPAVARQFERCQQALLEDVNAAPSPQTAALYESLMH